MFTNYPSFSDVALILTHLGVFGILINRRNILMAVIAIELMFYGLNFYLIATSIELDDFMGEIYSIFVLALAAAESALALAFITAYFRLYENILIFDENNHSI
jgi:NADH-quinone oxidoreductase subunit K